MEQKDVILQYYDYIRRIADSKCDTPQDAEDMVSETFLAAFGYLNRGGEISHPKTWLYNTFLHKWNGFLRKKYHSPIIVDYDSLNLSAINEVDMNDNEEAESLRRELLYLSRTTREVLIRYYYNGNSISEISRALQIPEGTVKSRLSAGRENIKKGLTEVKTQKNRVPGKLYISYCGNSGPNFHNTINLIADDLIAQNLLLLAYEKNATVTELAEMIGIPTVYIEPIINRLVDHELMGKTDGNKYYTDFIIEYPQDTLDGFEDLLKFVDDRFEKIWSVMDCAIKETDSLEFTQTLNFRQVRKLERYVIMRILQGFEQKLKGGDKIVYPVRKDGGKWLALGFAVPPEFDTTVSRKADGYNLYGGHRTIGENNEYFGAKFLRLHEFDTALWDSPRRFNACGMETYFTEIYKFLWCVYSGVSPDEGGISNAVIENIDTLIECTGLIVREDGKLKVDIPVVEQSVYAQMEDIIITCITKLEQVIGEDFKRFLVSRTLNIPKHLNGVYDFKKYNPAVTYFVMACVRKAYDMGLHLSDVDYCCPPVILVYDK